MILKLKYSDKTFMVESFGDHLMRAFQGFGHPLTLIVPVPLHWRRQWIRKYNQSSLLANALSKRCGLPVCHQGLKRVRPTKPLKGGSFKKRLAALEGAFALSPKEKQTLYGQHILLMDDVWTTGATLQSCADVLLKEGGAKSVSALTMARVLPADLS
jgi:ComF family protein